MERLQKCPLCGEPHSNIILKVKDHTTTQEYFDVCECVGCGFRFTNPQPSEKEIVRYYLSDKYISHTGGGKNLVDQIYRMARRYMLAFKSEIIHQEKASGKILDFGCGTGEFLSHMKKEGWDVNGVEPSDQARHLAEKLLEKGIDSKLKDDTEMLDVITLWHVLEHVHLLQETLILMNKKLKKGGVMFIAVPNSHSADAEFYKEHWAGYDVPRHLWHFSKETMEKVLHQSGFHLKKILPMKLDAYYISLLSEEYKNPGRSKFSYLTTALRKGLWSNHSAKKEMNYSSLIYVAGK